ncbi:MAG: CYTH domain-containing protein [Lachnospiraceae bacterium]|jgi:adenylate cyclase|nr:CYTH domain-containing protein [Lachnospiraceae bacterium]
MEIERKYLVTTPPRNYTSYPFHQIEQGYLCTNPVVRIRKQDQEYYLTYKSNGLMVREEYNLPLTEDAYRHLRQKTDGRLISKLRYCIPFQDSLTIELDIFQGELAPLMLAEVEFPSREEAEAFQPPEWFGEDVTFQGAYHNSALSLSK